MTREQWLDASDNRELCTTAGDLAWDALAGYHGARDQAVPHTADALQEMAADYAFSKRCGSIYTALDDPAGEIAREVLRTIGYFIRAGSIGFDAILAPAA